MKSVNEKDIGKKSDKKKRVLSMTASQRKKYYLKKAIVITLIVFAILALVYFIADNVDFESKNSSSQMGVSTKQKDEVYPTYTPFPAKSFDADIFLDEQYAKLDYTVKYGFDFEGGGLLPIEYVSEHEGHRFFERYFDILKTGSIGGYSSLFDKGYIASENFEKDIDRAFPPQMVYDITVREIQRGSADTSSDIYGTYLVDYKILRNDNLFRRDIGYNSEISSDVSRPLIFEILTKNPGKSNEKTTIRAIYTPSSITGAQK